MPWPVRDVSFELLEEPAQAPDSAPGQLAAVKEQVELDHVFFPIHRTAPSSRTSASGCGRGSGLCGPHRMRQDHHDQPSDAVL